MSFFNIIRRFKSQCNGFSFVTLNKIMPPGPGGFPAISPMRGRWLLSVQKITGEDKFPLAISAALCYYT